MKIEARLIRVISNTIGKITAGIGGQSIGFTKKMEIEKNRFVTLIKSTAEADLNTGFRFVGKCGPTQVKSVPEADLNTWMNLKQLFYWADGVCYPRV